MLKILGGLLAAVLIAAGGYFGFEFYVHQRVARDIDAAFAGIRENGGKASHGKVAFDLWTRTVTVADISVESPAQPGVTLRIKDFTAVGARSASGRFSADKIAAADVAVDGTL